MRVRLHQKTLMFLDVETTGLDPDTHEIIEVAVVWDEHGMALPRSVSHKVQPEHIQNALPKALEVNGYCKEDWTQAFTQEQAALFLKNQLQGCVIAGQRVGDFDLLFIKKLLTRVGYKVRFDRHVVDTTTLIYEHLVPCGLQSLSLNMACTFLGIEPETIHRAEGGARRAYLLYKRLSRATWLHRFWWKLTQKRRLERCETLRKQLYPSASS